MWITWFGDPVCNTVRMIQNRIMVRAFVKTFFMQCLSCTSQSRASSSIHHMQIELKISNVYVSSTDSCIISPKHKHCIFLLQIKVYCKPLSKSRVRFKTHWHKMNPMIAVKSYTLYTILKHLFIISKQRITFKIISLLVLLVLNYTTKCLFFWHSDSFLCVERQQNMETPGFPHIPFFIFEPNIH